jgi:hypothetical protein
MPTRNPVHYNSGTTLNNSISRNQMSFGVNDVDYGPTIQTKWYANTPIIGLIIISDSYSQGLTSEGNSYPIFWGTSGTTPADIMSLINGLPARSGLTRFTDPEAAMSWLQGEGVYGILNRTYENIVVSGLTLLYDAGTTLSYPLIGTSIYDLTTDDDNGTLLNGVSYSSSNGGVLVFSASSSQYITFDDLGTLSNFSVGCWFKLNAPLSPSTYPSLVTNTYSSGNSVNYTLGPIDSYNEITGGFFNSVWVNPEGFTPEIGQWYYVIVTYDGNKVKLYKDGTLFSQISSSANAVSTGLGGRIGRRWDATQYINANIGIVQIYDRALSATEVFTNLQAQAGRYSVPVPDLTFSGDSILFIDSNKSIYKYNPDTNLITYLYDTNIPGQVLDIAATSNSIFVNNNLGNIYKYTYTQSPFSAVLTQTYSFVNYVGSGMTAIDNNTILISSNNVYRINLTTSQVNLVFSLSATCANCITNGDILYNSSLNQYAISYINTGTSVNYSTVFDASGNTITTLNLQSFTGAQYTDLTNLRGLWIYNQEIYGVSHDLRIFNLGFGVSNVSTAGQPLNKLNETCVGSTSISSVPSWGILPPYFVYE